VLSVYASAKVACDYIRSERKPYLLEYRTERGRHHSSSSNPSGQILEPLRTSDPLLHFEAWLQQEKILSSSQIESLHAQTRATLLEKAEIVKAEPVSTDALSGMYFEG
ncbi:MAG: thiamine pyrophosphate-dependent enzyme, partial [Candidatus Sericytochromatia bacterium]